MTSLLKNWTHTHIDPYAPDAASIQAARAIADPSSNAWLEVATDGYSLWGTYKRSGKTPYRPKINLTALQAGDGQWHCTCASRKHPCKHILALLYMSVDHGDKIQFMQTPDHITEWLESLEDDDSSTPSSGQSPEDDERARAQRQRTYDKRKATIAAGMEELEHWLINLMKRGLADPQVKTYSFWDNRAARMVDAKAPNIAQWLRDMGGIPAQGNGTDWIEPLLEQLGRLYLVIESFKRFDELPSPIQGDIRTMIGWHIKKADVTNTETVEDRWIVTGYYLGNLNQNLTLRRVWLRGKDTNRDALLLDFVRKNDEFETTYRTGWSFDAALTYYPSNYPLRAFVKEQFSDIHADHFLTGETISESIQRYAAALAKNPWIEQYPFLLQNIIATRFSGQWILREVDGHYLPVAENFPHHWSLMALSGGHPIQVACEWNGESLYPTGAMVDDRYVDFNLIGKLT